MTPNFHGRSETAEAVRSSEHLFRTLFCNYDKENKDKLPFVFPTYSSFYDLGSKILQEIFIPSFLIQILLFFIQDSRKKNMLSVIIFKVAHETFLFDFRHAAFTNIVSNSREKTCFPLHYSQPRLNILILKVEERLFEFVCSISKRNFRAFIR